MSVPAELAVLLAATAGALAAGPRPGAARLRRLSMAPARRAQVPPPATGASGRARAASAVLLGFAGGWITGGFAGVLAGILLGALAWVGLGRLEPTAVVRARAATVQAVPLVADLLSAAVSAGSPPSRAVQVVADAVGGPLGARLHSAAAATRVGTDPATAWMTLAVDPAIRPLARALAATAARGTSPVPVLNRVAQDARDAARWEAESRARSVGARAAAPLGLCFLPAFVLVGIVPVVATAGPLLP